MSIPTSLIVVLLVVAWLVVLVPMVARRRERVPQAEPAGSNFRVLRRASASLRRRPGRGTKGRTMTDMDREGETSDTPTEVLATVGAPPDSQPMDAAEEWAAAQAGRARRNAPMRASGEDRPTSAPEPEIDDDQVALWSEDADVADADLADAEQPVRIGQVGRRDDELAPDRSTQEVGPGSAERSRTIPDEVDEDEWAAHAAAAPTGTYADVEAEQLRPVPHRPGRGGFDPEAAEATRAYRYQQRRRVTMILVIATMAFAVAAAVLVNWLWIGAGLSFALLVGYLAYLRRQVRIEAAIRLKRMERLQRARQIRPEYARAPRRTRTDTSAVTPGRTVVDLDDDDPGFDDLEEFDQPMTYRRAAGQ